MKTSTSKKTPGTNQLTQDEAKEVAELLGAIAESYSGGTSTKERRYHAKLMAIQAKIRRLY